MFCSECKLSKDLDCHKMEEPSQSEETEGFWMICKSMSALNPMTCTQRVRLLELDRNG